MSGEPVRGPAPRPCASCPYRQDVPSGIWAAEEYAKLPAYDNDTWAQPQGLFLCHQTGSDDPGARLCAGWVGCHGGQLLALRLAVTSGRVDPTVFEYRTAAPLFASGAAAAAHGMADVESPSVAAVAAGAKIAARRGLIDQ